ncbi:hypothetical protein [uncultured Christiangramia sp.]|uniref:hypothetical protein n=1 Tax=uncultured Christiangramia sp. TaxID=503836 RepID=UPI00260C6AAD|nr:hypothetical protein [uncultured Christiangramia sp.]
MRKAIRNRFWKIILFAALALMFWFFDLTLLAWIFGVLVIIPLLAGAIIWAFQKKPKHQGAYQPTVDNTTTPPVFEPKVKFSKPIENITFKIPLTEEQKKEFTEAMKIVNQKSNNDQIRNSDE